MTLRLMRSLNWYYLAKKSLTDYLITGVSKAAMGTVVGSTGAEFTQAAIDAWISSEGTCSEADLRQQTIKIKPLMRDLLNKLLANCPKATIIVTGYFPIISEESTGLTEAIKTLMPIYRKESQIIENLMILIRGNNCEKIRCFLRRVHKKLKGSSTRNKFKACCLCRH